MIAGSSRTVTISSLAIAAAAMVCSPRPAYSEAFFKMETMELGVGDKKKDCALNGVGQTRGFNFGSRDTQPIKPIDQNELINDYGYPCVVNADGSIISSESGLGAFSRYVGGPVAAAATSGLLGFAPGGLSVSWPSGSSSSSAAPAASVQLASYPYCDRVTVRTQWSQGRVVLLGGKYVFLLQIKKDE